jgi:hypothetical protein
VFHYTAWRIFSVPHDESRFYTAVPLKVVRMNFSPSVAGRGIPRSSPLIVSGNPLPRARTAKRFDLEHVRACFLWYFY